MSASTNRLLAGCRFHHVAIQTNDFENTKRFYTDVLGFHPVHEWEMGERRLCLLDMGDGGHVEVVGVAQTGSSANPPAQLPMLHLAIRVDNVDAAIQRVRAAGYSVTVEPKNVQLGTMAARIAFFVGPNGEVLEFFQEKADGLE